MTRKIISLLIIVSGTAALASAAPAVEPGVVLGLNLSRLSGQVIGLNWGTKGGFTGGAVLTFSLTDFFAIQPGLLYSQKGGRYEEPYEGGKIRMTLRFSYIDLPVVAKLALPLGEEAAFRPYVLGGASAGLRIGSKLRTDLVDPYDYEENLDESQVEGVKSFVLSLVLGAGLDFRIQNGRLLLECRYSRGLSSAFSEGPSSRLSTFSILAGFSFNSPF
jgi:hypothetical protein